MSWRNSAWGSGRAGRHEDGAKAGAAVTADVRAAAGGDAVPGAALAADSLDPDTRIGPLVSQAQLDRVTGYLDIGRAEGARILAGGQRLESDGYFVAPAILVDVEDGMRVARERSSARWAA